MTHEEQNTVSRVLICRIIEVEGEVKLKRNGWSDYRLTYVGAELYIGDLLRPAVGALVRVQCADGRTWRIPAGEVSGATNGCPPQSVPVSGHSGKIIKPRGKIDVLIPYIISPRCTSLLNRQPKLRWNATPNTLGYTVSLKTSKKIIWQTEVSETQVIYPGDPPLEPGVDYLLMVKNDTGDDSRAEGLPVQKFRLLNETNAQLVQADVEQLTKQRLTQETKALCLSYLYVKYTLRAEAIETLEGLVEKGSQTAAIYRSLGDFYRDVGVKELAEVRYLKAVELAAAIGDIEGEAVASACLGLIYDDFGNQKQSVHWFTQARNGYVALGDAQRACELDEHL